MDVGSERPLKLGGLPLLLWGQRDRKREAGGEEGGHLTQPTPSPACPPPQGCFLSPSACAFLDGLQQSSELPASVSGS